jgi:phosphate transport system substrate-binding protein
MGVAAAAVAMALGLSACGGAQQVQPRTVTVDGSSTVFPISEAVAEEFNNQQAGRVRATVGESGTGGGFRKFCRGEIEVQGASRPITASEMAECAAAGIRFVETPVAFDGLTVVVNLSNPVQSITVEELRRMWGPEAQDTITNWNQVNPSFPDLPMQLYGAGTASGTFDYFTEAVNGAPRSSRMDYTPTENDNVTVQGVTANPGAVGYFGIAYYLQNRNSLRALAVDNGDGPVEPTYETVQSGQYRPLSRPLFVYFNADALARPEVQEFAQFYLGHTARTAVEVGYVSLPAEAYEEYLARIRDVRTGTAFGGHAEVGLNIQEIIARPLVEEAAAAPAAEVAEPTADGAAPATP